MQSTSKKDRTGTVIISIVLSICIISMALIFGFLCHIIVDAVKPPIILPENLQGTYTSADGEILILDKEGFHFDPPRDWIIGPLYDSYGTVYETYDPKTDTKYKLDFISETTVEFYVNDRLIGVYQKEVTS